MKSFRNKPFTILLVSSTWVVESGLAFKVKRSEGESLKMYESEIVKRLISMERKSN